MYVCACVWNNNNNIIFYYFYLINKALIFACKVFKVVCLIFLFYFLSQYSHP